MQPTGITARMINDESYPFGARPYREYTFMFPGIGEHYVGMARRLYDNERVFRESVQESDRLLQQEFELKLLSVIYPDTAADRKDDKVGLDFRAMVSRRRPGIVAQTEIKKTVVAQPAVFVVEHALVQLLEQWGIYPKALIGYSLGEYVAACVAGVIRWDDALRVIVRRAKLIQRLPAGAMIGIGLPEKEIQKYLRDGISLAAVNGAVACIVAGGIDACEELANRLSHEDVPHRWLETTHALHSAMVEPIKEDLIGLLKNIQLSPPRIPFVSCVTGDWISDEEAVDPLYWARQMCNPVRFLEGLKAIVESKGTCLLEVGPGGSLSAYARQYCHRAGCASAVMIKALLRDQYDNQSDIHLIRRALEGVADVPS
jgi:phthiocerol/phenolphthiocerol synthesis type-I polyketide synthase E